MATTPLTGDEFAGSIYDKIEGDATLIGATGFANAVADCVYLGPNRPEGFPKYSATIVSQFIHMGEDQFQEGTMLLNVYLATLPKGSVDSRRFDVIVKRFVQLLHEVSLSVPGGTFFLIRYIGQLGPSWDPMASDEHYVTLRFRMWAAGTA